MRQKKVTRRFEGTLARIALAGFVAVNYIYRLSTGKKSVYFSRVRLMFSLIQAHADSPSIMVLMRSVQCFRSASMSVSGRGGSNT